MIRALTELKRTRRLRAAGQTPVADFLKHPPPVPATPVSELRLLAIDVETTGLDPETDQILSVGFVDVDAGQIPLVSAQHLVLRLEMGEVGQSATIHGITDDQVASGLSLEDGIEAVLGALRGRCLLAHHANIEVSFLTAACRRLWSVEPLFSVVDTLALQYRILTHVDEDPPPGSLRLWSARDQFNLPRYRAHNALTDALSAAELYLAQTQHLGCKRLKDLQR